MILEKIPGEIPQNVIFHFLQNRTTFIRNQANFVIFKVPRVSKKVQKWSYRTRSESSTKNRIDTLENKTHILRGRNCGPEIPASGLLWPYFEHFWGFAKKYFSEDLKNLTKIIGWLLINPRIRGFHNEFWSHWNFYQEILKNKKVIWDFWSMRFPIFWKKSFFFQLFGNIMDRKFHITFLFSNISW